MPALPLKTAAIDRAFTLIIMLSNTPDEQPDGSSLYSKLRAARRAQRRALLRTALPLLGLVLLVGAGLLLLSTNLAVSSSSVTVTPTSEAVATSTIAAKSGLISDPPPTPASTGTSLTADARTADARTADARTVCRCSRPTITPLREAHRA